LVGLARSSHRYQSTKDEQAALRMRLKELAAIRVHYGYRRLHILLRRQGWDVNAKRIYRRYREEQLSLRTKMPKRRVGCRSRVDRLKATRIDDC
ncbi:MAG: IS3 family transposase, partial [Pirellulaceae bacterium]